MKFDLSKSHKPNMFLGLYVPQESDFLHAQAVILPYGYEGTVTFGHGTDSGPEALIEASQQVELFDEELLDDIQDQVKIWTTEEPKIPKDPMEAAETLKSAVLEILDLKKLPVVIGGEHTISYGFAGAISERHKDVSILVFDAHMDLGDRYSGKDFTHAAWLKYSLALPNIKNATLVGVRNFNKLEYEYWQANKDKVKVFPARDRKNWDVERIISGLNENVYLSFDIDCFDASMVPSTGTPEPGGPMWDNILPIIRAVGARKNIIGIDLVELAPIKGLSAPDFMAAKLLMKMILYKFKAKELKN